ncbi:hypothetical protein PMZ80_008658 [Knufia obscura]|uniref:Uncharacterized protein n=1 Tax=Knufia obscura TaxID=1635080 RepID=A0ABR0RGU1_9EURO|nr:hypothetical protein PMZ80_008658 [Knufia obscura]
MAQDPQAHSNGEIIAVPATPPPQEPAAAADARSPAQSGRQRPTLSATPPRSAQTPHARRDEDADTAHLLATPTTTRRNASKDLPSTEYIEHAGIDELRNIAKSLVNDLTDARINNANARLQHHFLLLQTSQAAERAEVENQLSRRQVDFLRVKQNKPNASTTSPAVQPPSAATALFAQNLRDLDQHNEALEELCDQLKREKDLQDERIQSLSEHNSLLVNRIRENRQHFTKIRERSPVFPTPRETYTTPRRNGYSRYQDDTPFAALIAADQILSQETASVPSTPSKTHAAKVKHGHKRGAHSLSSVQTPKDRPNTSDGFLGSQLLLSAPASQLVSESAERERHDRDSTISISDDDRRAEREGLTQSQASSLAADMLRKNPSTFESLRQSQEAEKSSSLLQSKLFGNVKKSTSQERQESPKAKLKRAYGYSDQASKSKKIRSEDQVGLGIEA